MTESQIEVLRRLLNQRDLQLGLLRELDQAITSGVTAEKTVRSVLAQLVELLPASAATLFILNHEGYVFDQAFGAAASTARAPKPLPIDLTLPEGQVLSTEDLPPTLSWLEPETRAVLLYSISPQESPWALVIFEFTTSALPAETYDFAATALRQLTLYLSEARNRARWDRYLRLHDRFFSSDLNESTCHDVILEEVRDILARDQDLLAQILVHHTRPGQSATRYLRISASTTPAHIGTLVPFESLAGHAISSESDYLSADSDSADSMGHLLSLPFSRAELAIPIRSEDSSKSAAVLTIESGLATPFHREEVRALLELVRLAAPFLVAVHRRVTLAQHYRVATHAALSQYLGRVEALYRHRSASLLDVLRFNVHSSTKYLEQRDYDRLRAALSDISDASEQLTWFLRSLLSDLAELPAWRGLSLCALLDELLTEGGSSLRRYVVVDSSLSELPPVRASLLLKEHLRNVIVNAVESVEARETREASGSYEPVIRVHGELTSATAKTGSEGNDEIIEINRMVRLCVEDNGVGLAPSESHRVFEPGFSTKGSSGFALAAARQYLRELGGDVTVDSKENEYFAVTIRLPLAAADTEAGEESR